MNLLRLLQRKRLTVLGLNSGTSADGVDLAAIRIYASPFRWKLLAGHEVEMPANLRSEIHRSCENESGSLDDVIMMHNHLGRFFGRAAARFIRRLEASNIKVDLVASHGQTVRHLPLWRELLGTKVRGTLQLGSLDFIAAETGIITVGDFRQADVAAGGEGAPITTPAMQQLYRSEEESRLIVNIGGISNYFFVPSKGKPMAGDCGAGNSLSDILAQRLFNRPMDRDGRLAAAGEISEQLLTAMAEASTLSRRANSTGWEQFGQKMSDHIVKRARQLKLANADVLRSVAEMTVRGIARAVKPIIRGDTNVSSLYLTGGGRRNRFFVNRLQEMMPSVAVRDVSELGIDGDLVEASAYAVLGEACLRSRPVPTTKIVRKKEPDGLVLGHIVQPPLITKSRKRN